MAPKLKSKTKSSYPITENDVDELLRRENDDFIELYKKTTIEADLLPLLPSTDSVKDEKRNTYYCIYNKEHVSYDILQGCLINTNKSHLYFVKILKT